MQRTKNLHDQRYLSKVIFFPFSLQGPHNLKAASSCITMPAGDGRLFTAPVDTAPVEPTPGGSSTFTAKGYLKVDEAVAVEKHLTELLVSGTAHVT